MIRIDRLTVAYGAVQALREVSFEAATGEITAVIGANGAGKTTLLRTISGLVRARAGAIHLDDQPLLGRRPEVISRLGVAHVPEGRGVIEEFTVEENLRLGALHGHRPLVEDAPAEEPTATAPPASGVDADGPSDAASADVSNHASTDAPSDRPEPRQHRITLRELLAQQYELFPVLGDRRRQSAGTLSGGERQMLAMARALIAKPSVLLLDEPSLGLAPLVTAEIMRTIRELCSTLDLTVLLVEQDAMSALRVADRAVVLHVGRVAADDRAEVVAKDENLKHYYLGLAS